MPAMQIYHTLLSFATNPVHTRWIAPCLILAEAVLCSLIIWKIPYTEIDWETYMIQISKFLPPDPEFNYEKLDGPTGPLVYPAFHVYIHSLLYYITSNGRDVAFAQIIYAGLYLVSLAVVVACYRRANVPPWLLVPLVLSKRLHSIFLLRLFNDGWATAALWMAVHAAQRKRWALAAVIWSVGLGVKMILLLAAPGLAMVLIQGAGIKRAVSLGVVAFAMQLVAASPFLGYDQGLAYIRRAFDLGRQFLFKWTVNWRFVGEETFLTKEFAVNLLVLHASLLLVFLQTRWARPSSNGIMDFFKKYVTQNVTEQQSDSYSKNVTPVFVMDTMLGSMVIGLLCARSLHYQFYAYLGWATPYLLWRAGGNPIWVLANWAVQEYCWLVYPSTNLSSILVVLELALQMLSALLAPPVDHIRPPVPEKKAR